jgi:hypothetical protein
MSVRGRHEYDETSLMAAKRISVVVADDHPL